MASRCKGSRVHSPKSGGYWCQKTFLYLYLPCRVRAAGAAGEWSPGCRLISLGLPRKPSVPGLRVCDDAQLQGCCMR